jgi:hypothetical protein
MPKVRELLSLADKGGAGLEVLGSPTCSISVGDPSTNLSCLDGVEADEACEERWEWVESALSR